MRIVRRLAAALSKPDAVTFCDDCAQVCDAACRQQSRERDLTLSLYRAR